MKRIFSVVLLLLLKSLLWGHGEELPAGFVLEEEFVGGLVKPTDLKFAPDGRIFITEKRGTVRIVENGGLLEEPFYTVATQDPYERGLAGLVLDPDFDANGFVYLYHTDPLEAKNVVTRVTAAGNFVVPGSEVELIRFDEMYASWHNGGGMVFAPDGKLIVCTGDGTGYTSAQDMGNSLGKIHRINPDGSIPQDNPFYQSLPEEYRSIAAFGLRNPYTVAVSAETGRIFFNDVGNEAFEEVNEFLLGKNYGWHLTEGYLGGASPPVGEYADPIHAYSHEVGCAVVGATFYEPEVNLFPADYDGKYFFMDLCEGLVFCLDPVSHAVETFASGLEPHYNNLECGRDGNLYLLQYDLGKVARISYQGVNAPPVISVPPVSQTVPVGEDVLFSVEAAGSPTSYVWFKDGQEFQRGSAARLLLPNVDLSENGAAIEVEVVNDFGSVRSAVAVLQVVDGQRPAIVFNQVSASYRADDSIYFGAQVSDPDQASVPVDDWHWKIDFHHDTHTHPAMDWASGFDQGAYFVEPFGEVDDNVFFRITLSVTDSSGLTATESVEVQPEKVDLFFHSSPPGVPLVIDGKTVETDYLLRSVRQLRRQVDAPRATVVGDSLYEFRHWEDGSTEQSRIIPAEHDTFGLVYEARAAYQNLSTVTGQMLGFSDTGAISPPSQRADQ